MKMTERHKAMAYVLNVEFGYSMSKIANLMNVSQATVSNAIKDFKLKKYINDLEEELNQARMELKKLEYENNPQIIKSNFLL